MFKKISYMLILSILFMFIIGGLTVSAGGNTTTTKSTGLKSNQSQTFNVTLPSDVTSINSIKVIRGGNDKQSGDYNSCNGTAVGGTGLGSVNSYNLTGRTVSMSLSGSAWDTATCDSDYHSKSIKDYMLGSLNASSSSTRSYSSGGYSGTLNKKTHNSFTATDTRKDNASTASGTSFPNSISYSSGNHYGTLSKSGSPQRGSVVSGYYQSAHSKDVWGQSSSWYNDGTYSGSLSAYTVTTGSKIVTDMDTSRPFSSGAQCASVLGPSNMGYNDGVYSGTIYYSHCVERMMGAISVFYGYFTGTVYRYGTAYGGTVYRPEIDTRVYEYTQNYSGTVRQYDYEGTVYKGDWVTKRYNYTVEIDYHYNNAPSINTMNTDNDRYSEVSGYNVINLSGRATDPDGDSLAIHYEIANAKGSMNISSGSNYSFNIPIDSKIPEGTHTLRVWADDNDRDGIRTTSAVSTKSIIVDKTNPNGYLREINGPQSYQIDLDFYNVDATIAGAHSNPYKIQRSTNDGSFTDVYGWNSNDRFNDSNVLSNTKYSYRGIVRDSVGHFYTTNWVEFVTSPEVKSKSKYFEDEDPATIILELEETLPNGVVVEVKRSGSLIYILESGDRIVDNNLDYERQYTYELTAVTTDRFGNRMESVPITITVSTGVPTLELELDHDYNKIYDIYTVERTIFSDKVEVKGHVYYRHGGDVGLIHRDKTGRNEESIALSPYETKNFTLDNRYDIGQLSDVRAELKDRGLDISDTENIEIELKPVTIEKITSAKYTNIFD